MVGEVVWAIGVGRPDRSQAARVFHQQCGGMPRRCGAVAIKAVGPVLVFRSLGRRPIAPGECPQVPRVHLVIVLSTARVRDRCAGSRRAPPPGGCEGYYVSVQGGKMVEKVLEPERIS